MFPNVRLIVVAILAAITGISCGLALFATFRVNHEPLARLAEGSPPLQLALNNRALGLKAGASLEARLPGKDAAKLISVPAIIATPTREPNPAPSSAPSPAPSSASSSAPSSAPSRTPSPAPEQSGADPALAGDSSVQDAAAVDQNKTASLAVPAEQSIAAPERPIRSRSMRNRPTRNRPIHGPMAPPRPHNRSSGSRSSGTARRGKRRRPPNPLLQPRPAG